MSNDPDIFLAIFFPLMILGMALFWMVWMSFIIGSVVFWVMMLVDAAKREYPKPDDKVVWILVVALAGVVGALIYYFAVKRPASTAVKAQAKV